MKKNKLNFPVKLISLISVIFLVLIFIIVYTWTVIKNSSVFKIKDVIVRDAGNINLSYLKGKNIFSVDLKRESGGLLAYFPECKNVRLVRLLPNRIFVDFIRRKPIALIKLYKFFALDEDGVLFDAAGGLQQSGFPVIVGLETKIFGAKAGRKYDIRELRFALNIIKEIKRNRILRDYKIRKIEAASLTNTSIFLIPPPSEYDYIDMTLRVEGIEIKLSSDGIRHKIAMLANLMVAARSEWNNIKYIELRFKEPVLKLKDTK